MKRHLLLTLLLLAGAAGFPPGNVVTGPEPCLAASAGILVLDADGRPVCGARVSSIRGETRSDGNGKAVVPIMSGYGGTPTQDWTGKRVTVSAPGFVPISFKAGWNNPDVARLLMRGRVVSGRCVDSDGNPVPGLSLRLRFDGWREPDVEVVTDEAGAFYTDQAPPCDLTLALVDGARVARPLPIIPPQTDVELITHRAARISGTLRFPKDERPSYLHVTYGLTAEPAAGVRVIGLDDGEFRIHAPPGEITLFWKGRRLGRFVLEEGESRDAILLDVPPEPECLPPPGGPSGRPDTGAVTPRPRDKRGRIRGRIVDVRGEVVADGSIMLRTGGTREVVRSASLTEFPGRAGGEFAFSGLEPGVYDLVWASRFLHQDLVLLRNVRMPDPRETVELHDVAVRFRPVRLRVAVRGRGGKALPGAVVRLDPGKPPIAVRTDRYGLAEIDLFDPTDLEVEASSPGFRARKIRLGTDGIPSLVVIRLR